MAFLAQEVIWQFIVQGVIAPGLDNLNPDPPWFHITEYGKKVLAEERFIPHDPTGYLKHFRNQITNPDPTVESYLLESLRCFVTGTLVASVVMLGVASERAFLLLCNVLSDAIADGTEKAKFEKLLKPNAIKPKMDWVHDKILSIQKKTPRALPDNVNIMLATIFDFIRSQRNDLGHPQEKPPEVEREDAYVNLRIFPKYIKMLNQVIDYLKSNKV